MNTLRHRNILSCLKRQRNGLFNCINKQDEFEWSEEPLKTSLLSLDKELVDVSIQCSRIIVETMEIPHSLEKKTDEICKLLVEVRKKEKIKDEIYFQLLKQLINNKNPQSYFTGLEILYSISCEFPPSKSHFLLFEDFLLEEATEKKEMKKYIHRILWEMKKDSIFIENKNKTKEKISFLLKKFKGKAVFCESLSVLMKQFPSNPPEILIRICREILSRPEKGIFRVSCDKNILRELREEIENGKYQKIYKESSIVLSCLLKEWLSSLGEPVLFIVPKGYKKLFYNYTRDFSVIKNETQIVLNYLLDFFSNLTEKNIVQKTMLDIKSLSIVVSPCLFHSFDKYNENIHSKVTEEIDFVIWLVEKTQQGRT